MDQDAIATLMGAEVRSVDQHRLGEVEQVFVDDETGAPTWVTVHAGAFGASESYIPVQAAELEGGVLRVPFEKQVIADAPRVAADHGHLSPEEEQGLYRHYHSAGDTALIRSEERLQVGKQIVRTGTLRLRKRIVTETRMVEVSVSREELVVDDGEIFDDASPAPAVEAALSEEEFDIMLHEEHVVVEKRVVPFERVRVRRHVVHGTTTVSDQVRKERIDAQLDGDS